jgi:hypothetical protein
VYEMTKPEAEATEGLEVGAAEEARVLLDERAKVGTGELEVVTVALTTE